MRTYNRAATKRADTPVTDPTMAMMAAPLLESSWEPASEDMLSLDVVKGSGVKNNQARAKDIWQNTGSIWTCDSKCATFPSTAKSQLAKEDRMI